MTDDELLKQLHADLQTEYGKLVDLVDKFDNRLVTIKSWGVTISLAGLGVGFQQAHFGLFLVAALGGLAFWILEGVTKGHQMRYYTRMREIEIISYDRYGVATTDGTIHSSPLIDWRWMNPLAPGRPTPNGTPVNARNGLYGFLFPHVMLPHLVTLLAGLALFALGSIGKLGAINKI